MPAEVSGYIGTFSVEEVDASTSVLTWCAHFESSDPVLIKGMLEEMIGGSLAGVAELAQSDAPIVVYVSTLCVRILGAAMGTSCAPLAKAPLAIKLWQTIRSGGEWVSPEEGGLQAILPSRHRRDQSDRALDAFAACRTGRCLGGAARSS